MRLFAIAGPCAALAACAAPAAPPLPASDAVHQACLSRKAAARVRGAQHWHVYQYCLREPS